MTSKEPEMLRLGVNIDHVATLRQARGTPYPDVIEAARIAIENGADGITAHLREDRRHIQDHDLPALRALSAPLNMEMAVTDEMLSIAESLKPNACCLVPEKREELTTEGGLDVAGNLERVRQACERIRHFGGRPSLFIDPDMAQLEAAVHAQTEVVEIHTGHYALMAGEERAKILQQIEQFAKAAAQAGIEVHAGHGLTTNNVGVVAAIPEIVELNIGHALICDAVMLGMADAVRGMRQAMMQARFSAA